MEQKIKKMHTIWLKIKRWNVLLWNYIIRKWSHFSWQREKSCGPVTQTRDSFKVHVGRCNHNTVFHFLIAVLCYTRGREKESGSKKFMKEPNHTNRFSLSHMSDLRKLAAFISIFLHFPLNIRRKFRSGPVIRVM